MTEEPTLMSKGRILAFGIYMIVLSLLLIYGLAKIWPAKMPGGLEGNIYLFGKWHFYLWPEPRYLLIVTFTGALGSFIHLATSFADFLGNRQLYGSWGWWYILRPFIGTALAILMYFAVRGGLIASSGGADSLSPYGVAAIAGMAGLFSKQATDKLREVFEDLFKTTRPPDRSDKLTNQ
ncbi:MAG: hypothetical protein P4L87_21710 [Formivibrio sp.]|nr:hypothetical protein [Formivibrio sp.]